MRVNIEIMRAFVTLCQLLSTPQDLSRKIQRLEKKYDYRFKIVFDAIYKLMTLSEYDDYKDEIGFLADRNKRSERK